MRYSFHGKVRATSQQVDGFVEAVNATEAIDRLADRGIIGVYSVHPEPKPVKNAVRLAGEAEPAEEADPRQLRRLIGPTVVPRRIAVAPPKPAPIPQAPALVGTAPAAPVAPPAPSAQVAPATEAMLLQVVEKLTTLMGRVEQALSRPMNVMYQNAPARNSGFTPIKRSGKIPQDVQTSTLHDIFQNNLDLRKSLDKLASTVGPPPVKVVEDSSPDSAPAPAPTTQPATTTVARETQAQREPLRESPKPAREQASSSQKLVVQAQPA